MSTQRREYEPILAFWFGPAPGDPAAIAREQPRWWRSDPAFDGELRDRFLDLWTAAASGGLDAWTSEPRGALALVILLDQLSRNLERGRARAFAQDRRAREVALQAIAAGDDRALLPPERQFLYLPFEHSEDLADQRRSVELFTRLVEDAGPEWRALTEDALHWARVHLEIVERFGRFPHRNHVLGRSSTADEERWLREGGPSFGQ
jgi:uncharacterized protein (DUF924 family)